MGQKERASLYNQPEIAVHQVRTCLVLCHALPSPSHQCLPLIRRVRLPGCGAGTYERNDTSLRCKLLRTIRELATGKAAENEDPLRATLFPDMMQFFLFSF